MSHQSVKYLGIKALLLPGVLGALMVTLSPESFILPRPESSFRPCLLPEGDSDLTDIGDSSVLGVMVIAFLIILGEFRMVL